MDSPFAGDPRAAAPEFPSGLDWINVDQPLSLQGLRGKIIILDFWTYGCINCIHMIPTLRRLEERYADSLVVIGVHSAKFENEGQTENLRQIVQRYELHHPVINDSDFRVWRQYGVRAWPTFVVIDPRGNVLALQPGEVPFDAFDNLLAGMVDFWSGTGELNTEPLELALEGAGMPAGALAFPGKVLADEAGGRLFISDSNHHRIIVADLNTYAVQTVIGNGSRGLADGDFATAQFSQPQGMALSADGSTLYVADTQNHVVRAADLNAGTVTTIAGTGIQSYERHAPEEGEFALAAETGISSPWALELDDASQTLYIAMAGPHQIWAINLSNGMMRVAIGNGREALLSATFASSELAQPSGLHLHDGVLYIADSESSSIRAAEIERRVVRTVSGTTANDLFDYGDIDGVAGVSRLQHPLGVTGSPDGLIYIADTYNSRIKQYDPATGETTTLFGLGGRGGFRDGDAQTAEFDEPGGLSYANGRLYIADTNNHAIRVIDLASGQVSTVMFPNPEVLQIADRTTVIGGNAAMNEVIAFETQTLGAGSGAIEVTFSLPAGYKVNDEAPSRAVWNVSGSGAVINEGLLEMPIAETTFSVPLTLSEGEGVISGELTLYYCEETAETLCFIEQFSVEIPVTVSATGATSISVERVVVPPEL